jgi:hypothetical protein
VRPLAGRQAPIAVRTAVLENGDLPLTLLRRELEARLR